MKSILFFVMFCCLSLGCKKNMSYGKEEAQQPIQEHTSKKVTRVEDKKTVTISTNFITHLEVPTPTKLQSVVPLKVFKTKSIDFDGDGELDFLSYGNKKIANGTVLTEYWIKSNFEVLREKEIYDEYDSTWFVNLDTDNKLEMIKAQGNEDGINYGVYKLNFELKNDELAFYFNPAIEYDGKFYWGYPWEIEDIVLDKKRREKVILKHHIKRDGNILRLENQKTLPIIIFSGQTQREYRIDSVGSTTYLTFQKLKEKLF